MVTVNNFVLKFKNAGSGYCGWYPCFQVMTKVFRLCLGAVKILCVAT